MNLYQIHELFSDFDEAVMKFQLFKLDTIGDAYIIVGWLHGIAEDLTNDEIDAQIKNETHPKKIARTPSSTTLRKLVVVPLKVVAYGWRAILRKAKSFMSKSPKSRWWSWRNSVNKVQDGSESATCRHAQGCKASEASQANRDANDRDADDSHANDSDANVRIV